MQVLLNGKKATGVEYIRNERKQNIYCRKEVVVSAGTINSPQILMLSGIGPRQHLNELEVGS